MLNFLKIAKRGINMRLTFISWILVLSALEDIRTKVLLGASNSQKNFVSGASNNLLEYIASIISP